MVSLPLLLLGFFASQYGRPYKTAVYSLCFGDTNSEDCRSFGEPGDSLYESQKNKMPAWFQVYTPSMDGTYDPYMTEASVRPIGQIMVDTVAPLNVGIDSPQAIEAARKLAGRPARMKLGIEKGVFSADYGNDIVLFCHSMYFGRQSSEWFKNPGPYVADCTGDQWSALISFTLNPESEKQLVRLRDEVDGRVKDREFKNTAERYTFIALPLILFLLISGMVWLVRRAIAFVKAG